MIQMNSIKNILAIILLSVSTYSLSGQCIENTHSPFENQSWLSCSESQNPIAQRGVNHWLEYDLGYTYILDSIQIWNYNVWGSTGNGVRQILIDYSEDGNDWESIGPLDVDQAPGSWKYNSPAGFDLGNISARKLVITVLQTWDDQANCAGIGEIKIAVSLPTSIQDIDEEALLSLSPNPAFDMIKLEVGGISVDNKAYVLNGLGQVVMNLGQMNAGTSSIDVSVLDDGMYFLVVQTRDDSYKQSFVKVGR